MSEHFTNQYYPFSKKEMQVEFQRNIENFNNADGGWIEARHGKIKVAGFVSALNLSDVPREWDEASIVLTNQRFSPVFFLPYNGSQICWAPCSDGKVVQIHAHKSDLINEISVGDWVEIEAVAFDVSKFDGVSQGFFMIDPQNANLKEYKLTEIQMPHGIRPVPCPRISMADPETKITIIPYIPLRSSKGKYFENTRKKEVI